MQHVIRGRGCFDRANLLAVMEALSLQRPLLVCGKRMQQIFAGRVGMDFPVFSGYHPNPDLADSEAGAEMYRRENCDGLISLGGGSAMDTAKAVKALLLTGDMEKVKRSELPEDVWLPHIAIPATAGTGAEATPFAVVYVAGRKLSLDHAALLPEAVLLDGSLLDTLPEYHRKACAMDALCQGIESYWATGATEESRVHAARAIRGAVRSYNAHILGDRDAQDAMLEAAYESGVAIRVSRTTAAHAMSYQLTKRFGFAHGHACMLTLPHLWRMAEAEEVLRPLLAELAQHIGAQEAAQVPGLLTGMLACSDMLPRTAADAETLDALAATVDAQRLTNHPQKLTAEALRAVYARALTPVEEQTRQEAAERWSRFTKG